MGEQLREQLGGEREDRERRRERERKDEEREGEGELERPGGNRTTPSKADHCQPEEETCIIIITTPSRERERERESSHRADLRALRHKKSKKYSKENKTVQYVRFPGGPPPEYWTRPWLLSFGDRTGSGVSNQV